LATEILWRNNCGVLPVLDLDGKLLGILTDRDMCIALGTRNLRASDLAAGDAARKPVFSCGPNDDVHDALKAMCEHQIRRVPVVEREGRLAGIVSLDDIVLHAEKTAGATESISYDDVINTMKAICERYGAEAPKATKKVAGAVRTL
jgi:signal-transduction protein with cAMP-binding, CBS, and nucleotidyltransferase domain